MAAIALFTLAWPDDSRAGEPWRDSRGTFEPGLYIGDSIDTFAASDLKRYLNPESASGVQHRFVGGFDFAYRLVDSAGIPKLNDHGQFWLYGETIHGVRSTAIDCGQNPANPLCTPLTANAAGEKTLYILRNATSLEAFLGGRYEFKQVRGETNAPVNLYLKAQAGFLTVTGAGDSPDE